MDMRHFFKYNEPPVWLLYFITCVGSVVILTILSAICVAFVGTMYITYPDSEIISILSDSGYTMDTFKTILDISEGWVMFVASAFLVLTVWNITTWYLNKK
jgi:hypothetical protein